MYFYQTYLPKQVYKVYKYKHFCTTYLDNLYSYTRNRPKIQIRPPAAYILCVYTGARKNTHTHTHTNTKTKLGKISRPFLACFPVEPNSRNRRTLAIHRAAPYNTRKAHSFTSYHAKNCFRRVCSQFFCLAILVPEYLMSEEEMLAFILVYRELFYVMQLKSLEFGEGGFNIGGVSYR